MLKDSDLPQDIEHAESIIQFEMCKVKQNLEIYPKIFLAELYEHQKTKTVANDDLWTHSILRESPQNQLYSRSHICSGRVPIMDQM
jgi:hypothetical protein